VSHNRPRSRSLEKRTAKRRGKTANHLILTAYGKTKSTSCRKENEERQEWKREGTSFFRLEDLRNLGRNLEKKITEPTDGISYGIVLCDRQSKKGGGNREVRDKCVNTFRRSGKRLDGKEWAINGRNLSVERPQEREKKE